MRIHLATRQNELFEDLIELRVPEDRTYRMTMNIGNGPTVHSLSKYKLETDGQICYNE